MVEVLRNTWIHPSRDEIGSNMEKSTMTMDIREPDSFVPDGKGGRTPVWMCPKCTELKTLDEFGLRLRDDAYPGQNRVQKQSWCKDCR